MAKIIEIADPGLPELKMFSGLTDAEMRTEPSSPFFIAEGTKIIGHALNAGVKPLAFLMERKHIYGKAAAVLSRCPEVPVYTGDSELLASMTGFRLTRGVLAAMKRPEPQDPEPLLGSAERIAVLEGVGDAANVGALIRSAAALGMDAVLITPGTCDPLHRRAVRVSMGTVFQVPWAVLAPWPEHGLARLREMGFATAALALTDRSVPLGDPGPAGERKLAMILGSEGDGLKQETVAAADYTVRIPMTNGVDSLNVAAAGAVAFWELAMKQRRNGDAAREDI